MKDQWKWLTGVALSGALILTLGFGAAPRVFAQSQPQSQQPAPRMPALGSFAGFGMGMHGQSRATLATALGISETDLQSAFESGKSVAEVATEKGVTLNTVINALVAEQSTRLAEAMTAGRITQAQADALIANLRENLPELLNLKPLPASVGLGRGIGGRGLGGPGFGGRNGRGSEQGQPRSPLAPTPTPAQ